MSPDLRAVTDFVLALAEAERCRWDYDPETSAFAPDGCRGLAVFEVEGPHDMRCGVYCAEHAPRVLADRCEPPHRFFTNRRHNLNALAQAVEAASRLQAADP